MTTKNNTTKKQQTNDNDDSTTMTIQQPLLKDQLLINLYDNGKVEIKSSLSEQQTYYTLINIIKEQHKTIKKP